jgi:hypothetical protein
MGRCKVRLWKKKKKKAILNYIPLPILMRQAIYDSMLEPAELIAISMGLPPISDEVSEMEERASQTRLREISALIPFIDAHSDIIAKIATASYVLDEDDDDEDNEVLDKDDLAKMDSLFKIVALSSSMSCVSSLISLGLIENKVPNND